MTRVLLVCASLMVSVLTPGIGYGQMNKCIDASGRTSYSDKPCARGQSTVPRSERVAPTKRSTSAERSPGSKREPAPATTSGIPPMPSVAAKQCAEEWPGTRAWIIPDRVTSETARIASDRQRAKESVAETATRFMRPCARHGFLTPADNKAMQHNDELAERILRKFQVDYERRVAWEAEQQAKEPRRKPPSASLSSPGHDSPTSEWMEANKMELCVNEWETFMDIQRTTWVGSRGRKPSEQQLAFQADQRRNVMNRILAECERFGFEDARDSAGDARNSAVAKKLKIQVTEVRQAIETAETRDRIERDALQRNVRLEREQEELKQRCQRDQKALEEAREDLAKLPSDQQALYQGNLSRAEAQWRSACGK